MSWASNHDGSLGDLFKVQGSLAVGLIMTPRSELATCKLDETAEQVNSRNPNRFSFFPVTCDNDGIIGLYDASRWFDAKAPPTPIKGDFLHLSEDIVIGADASIVEFVRHADQTPTKLVVLGDKFGGLVSLSDLQKLPVRAALFTMITSLEIALAKAIESAMPEPSSWMAKLTDNRRAILEGEIKKAVISDAFVDAIFFTQFSDKADIFIKAKLLSHSRKKLVKIFKSIRNLRDAVAHGNTYAETPEKARRVCETVRQIELLKLELRQEPRSEVEPT
jgi:hypothetical protein